MTGPDDYASMKEVVRRRYSRAIEEGSPLPDLIITDGGKGQMEVVREVIEDELHLDIPIAGLAKDRKHRTSELLYGFPPLTIGVKQSTPLFHLLETYRTRYTASPSPFTGTNEARVRWRPLWTISRE